MKKTASAFSMGVISAFILLFHTAALADTVFSSALNGSQSTPANNSPAAGVGSVILNIAETQVTVTLYFAGLSSAQTSATVRGPASAGSQGAVVFSLPNGNITQSFPVTSQQAADLKAGLWYFEIGSVDIPTGEIRGQINAATGTPVPFPTTSGSLDATFGTNGILTTAVGPGNCVAQATAIQADGKIVVAGFAFNGANNDFAIVRYNPNGTLDDTFDGNSGNGNGIIMTPVGASDDEAFGIAIQPDGKILLAGQTRNPSNEDVAVVRYNTDGTLDSSFGSGGIVVITAAAGNDLARSIAIQSDGKIVVVGNAADTTTSDILVIRLNANGSLDATLDGNSGNGNGIVTTPVGTGNDLGYAVAVQPDGKIVVAGYYFAPGSNDTVVLRYQTDGRLDSTFDGDGIAPHSFSAADTDEAFAMALQPDGKIVIVGCIRGNGRLNDYLIARLDQNGAADASFGTGGLTIVQFSDFADIAQGVIVQPDGKIVAAGFASNGTNNDFGVTRLNANGTLDPSFGNGGRLMTMIGASVDSANAIALQPDGKIVVVGRTVIGSTASFGVARYGYGINGQQNDGLISLDPITAIRFDNVQTSGASFVTNPSSAALPPLPSGWSYIGSPRNIQTSALFSGTILVRLMLPAGLTLTNFNAARVLQYENGAWADKTTDSPARDFASKTIYARVSSLSPIAAASPNGPVSITSSISGKLSNPLGGAVRVATVTLTPYGGSRSYTSVNPFGYFRFSGLASGTTVLINISAKGKVFEPFLTSLNDDLLQLNLTSR